MTREVLLRNWGLVLAAILMLVVIAWVVGARASGGPGARLRRQVRELQARRRALDKARRSVTKAEARLAALRDRASQVPPRRIDEAEGTVEDARALAGIEHDRYLVAANLVRRIIYDEFAPRHHERLRARYLPPDTPGNRPTTG